MHLLGAAGWRPPGMSGDEPSRPLERRPALPELRHPRHRGAAKRAGHERRSLDRIGLVVVRGIDGRSLARRRGSGPRRGHVHLGAGAAARSRENTRRDDKDRSRHGSDLSLKECQHCKPRHPPDQGTGTPFDLKPDRRSWGSTPGIGHGTAHALQWPLLRRNRPTKVSSEAVASAPGGGMGQIVDFMSVVWALNHALGSLSKRMDARLGVTGPQRLVVRMVGHLSEVSAGRLASILRVHPSTLTGVLKRLVGRRVLVRRPDPADGRRALFSLTPLGRSVDRLRSGTVEAAISRALRRFSGREAEIAERVLASIARAVEEEGQRDQQRHRTRRARRGDAPSRTR